MEQDELVRLSDISLWEAYREHIRRSPGGVIQEGDGLLLHAGAHPTRAFVNGAKRTDVSMPAEEVLARADAFFAARGHDYTIMVRTHADSDLEEGLLDAGFTRMYDNAGMILEHRFEDREAPPGVEIRRVSSAPESRDFAGVNAEVFEGDDAGMKGFVHTLFADVRSLVAPHIAGFVAYLEGAPVSAALTLVSHGVAWLGWVVTKEAVRGRGLGEAVTRTAANAGFDLGARMASLQASKMGEPLYRRMGFVEITRYFSYVRPREDRRGV